MIVFNHTVRGSSTSRACVWPQAGHRRKKWL